MVSLEFAAVIIGIIYGYIKPGKEDRRALLKKGIIIGIILALILTVLGLLFSGAKLFLLTSVIGVVMFIEVLIMVILFIVGTLIGDWLEEKTKK